MIGREERAGGVLVTGATGLIGLRLLPALVERYAWVRALSRSGDAAARGVEVRTWDGIDPGPTSLDGVEVLIHLAGEPIFGGLPTEARLERIRTSRVDSTRRLVERLLERAPEERPRVLLCASAVGFYGDVGEDALDEDAQVGDGFLAELCRDWEHEAARAEQAGTRVVQLRIGVVIAREGGALPLMKLPFSLGLGGRLGHGRQFFPWIHASDLVNVVLHCLETDLRGPVNAVAPEAVRNEDLTRALARELRRPAILPVPAIALRALLGPISGELLGSRRVVPARLEASGFAFAYPSLRSALAVELGVPSTN